MNICRCKNLIAGVCLSFCSMGINASEPGSEGHHDAEESHAKHTLGIFAGYTRENNENHETFGFDYSYRINESWSLGGVIERAPHEKDSTLAIIFAHWWPYKEWFLGAGIGEKDPGHKNELTIRATVGYEFILGNGWVIAPEISLDIIQDHENEEVFGVTLGKQF